MNPKDVNCLNCFLAYHTCSINIRCSYLYLYYYSYLGGHMKASFVYILVSSSFSVWNFQSVNEDRIFFFFFFFQNFLFHFLKINWKGGRGRNQKEEQKKCTFQLWSKIPNYKINRWIVKSKENRDWRENRQGTQTSEKSSRLITVTLWSTKATCPFATVGVEWTGKPNVCSNNRGPRFKWTYLKDKLAKVPLIKEV